jgi:hypothetical protein
MQRHMEASYQFPSSWPRRAGHAVIAALVLLSLWLYQERTLLLDIAYQTFLMITEGKPQVMVNRFGVVLIQALPLAGIKLGLPLKVVLLLYSASFPLLFWAFYTLIVRVLRNDYLGWALVFLYTLIVYDAFYWAPSEQQQALGLLLVVFAFLLRFPALDRPWMMGIMAAAMPALAYYHPLVFIPFFFLWAYGALTLPELRHWRYGAVAGWMVLVLILKSVFSGNWYDDNKYDTFFKNLIEFFPNYLQLPSNAKFLAHSLQYWYFFPLMLIVVSGYLAWRRRWWLLGLIWVFCLGHLALLHIGSPNASYRFYAEVNYMPLMVYVGVPFMLDIVKRHPHRYWIWLLVGLAVFRLAVIAQHRKPFTGRIDWLASHLQEWRRQTGARNFYLPLSQAPTDTLLMTWGVPYETLLLSSLESPDNTATLVVLPEPGAHAEALKNGGFLVTEFKDWPLDSLRQGYFEMDGGGYVFVEE